MILYKIKLLCVDGSVLEFSRETEASGDFTNTKESLYVCVCICV
jgi:hypothetical protein